MLAEVKHPGVLFFSKRGLLLLNCNLKIERLFSYHYQLDCFEISHSENCQHVTTTIKWVPTEISVDKKLAYEGNFWNLPTLTNFCFNSITYFDMQVTWKVIEFFHLSTKVYGSLEIFFAAREINFHSKNFLSFKRWIISIKNLQEFQF